MSDKVSINGVEIFPFTSKQELIDFVTDKKGILVAINAEKILHATEVTKAIINKNIGYSDGMGAVMALKKKGFNHVEKIAGCELWLEIIKSGYKNKSFYLVGGKQQVIENTVEKLKKEFPGMNILNYRNGYLNTENDEQDLLNDIKNQKPDVVFVAMGSPKQELLMEKMLQVHEAVYQGLGGSFDVYTGNMKRAPKWWIDHNLEFAYRLFNQPSRITRQIYLLSFFFKLQLRMF